MKIVVNESKAKERKQEVINDILAKAKECAEKGLDCFLYTFRPDERRSFPPPCINVSIKKASEGTVECGYRSDYGSSVRYYITKEECIPKKKNAPVNTKDHRSTTEKEKAIELKDKFGELADLVIDEMLDNTSECRSRYRTNYDEVCIRQYWIGVRKELKK